MTSSGPDKNTGGKSPPVRKGDEIFIDRGGRAGQWQVRDVRGAGSSVTVVLARGSILIKTRFDAAEMRVISKTPAYELRSGMTPVKTVRFGKPR